MFWQPFLFYSLTFYLLMISLILIDLNSTRIIISTVLITTNIIMGTNHDCFSILISKYAHNILILLVVNNIWLVIDTVGIFIKVIKNVIGYIIEWFNISMISWFSVFIILSKWFLMLRVSIWFALKPFAKKITVIITLYILIDSFCRLLLLT